MGEKGKNEMTDDQSQLDRKMAELSIDGFSSMGEFSAEDQFGHLSEIETILSGRKARVAKMQASESQQ